ncbi:tRNA-intron lyase [Halobacteria archaeon HArc-gm2]|nr:tRNA-intron lyase [Halobacteria archaeon HArc-gm2]
MNATLAGDVVRAGKQARERFYDARGYGRPVDGGALELAPVEAAHLLYRGDLDDVDGMDVGEFLASAAVSEVAFFVYKDLRDRGFYLSRPAPTEGNREADVDDRSVDFEVYPRGKGPWDDEVAYHVCVVSERESVAAESLGDCVLAVVDEESEITYLETGRPEVSGTSASEIPPVQGSLLADRVLCWDPPAELYERGFYGQRLDDQDGGDGAVQLSLVEAASLAHEGVLSVDGGADAVRERGREVEGDRFDRRLRVYERLREEGMVPKTGFKFGADFRTYADVESVDDLGHSELLVRVLPADHVFEPRDLALDVRLAHGVRKTMVFALVDDEGVSWVDVERLTP